MIDNAVSALDLEMSPGTYKPILANLVVNSAKLKVKYQINYLPDNQKIITQTVIICMFKIHLFLSITPIQIDTIPHSAEEYI